jgi:hypothetical protein
MPTTPAAPPIDPMIQRFVAATSQAAKLAGFPAIVIAVRSKDGQGHVFQSAGGLENLKPELAEKLGLDECDTGWPG